MRTYPEFAEVPAPKMRDMQYRLYLYLLAGFAAYALLNSSPLASMLIVIPAAGVALILWLRRRTNSWSAQGAPPYRKHDSRIRLGWSRTSNPQYAGRGTTLFPHGAFGGGAIFDGYASLPLVIAATLLLLPALLLGLVIGLALWLKRQFQRRPETFLIR